MRKLSRNLAVYVCMFVAVFCAMALKAEAASVTTGTLGDNGGIAWAYDADTKTLTITGEDEGILGDYGGSVFIDICPEVEHIIVKNCTLYNCGGMFSELEKVQSITFENFDTSQVSDMNSMFHNCKSLSNLDVSAFDTSRVIDMSCMFKDCESLESVDVSGFDTSKVINMGWMFYGCSNLSSLDVSGFDTSNVESMIAMFNRCASLSSLNLSGFNTSKVTNMRTMFYGCKNLSNLDLSKFDTSQVTAMASMFRDCHSLSDLDVSNFDTTRVTDVNWMFYNCINLKSLDLSSFDFSSVTGAEDMLASCDDIEVIYTPKKLAENVSIELPCTFVDEKGNLINYITRELCNKTLYEQSVGQVRAFVERMYTVALGRASDPSGINYWTDELLSHRKDGAAISVGFIMSEEFEKKNYSNEEYLKVLYRTFFDREADEGGMNFWLEQMKAGRSRKSVLAGFVNSKEFTEICESYGINRGTMEDDATATGAGQFVERLYTIAFERPSDPSGLESWAQRINDKTVTPEQVAKEFFLSPEYAEKNTSNDKYVETLYLVFMDRTSEKDGKAYWVEQLNQGVSRESVLEGFAQSEEFKEIMARYGL